MAMDMTSIVGMLATIFALVGFAIVGYKSYGKKNTQLSMPTLVTGVITFAGGSAVATVPYIAEWLKVLLAPALGFVGGAFAVLALIWGYKEFYGTVKSVAK